MNEACAGMGNVLVEVRAGSEEFLVDITVDGVITVVDLETAADLSELIATALQLANVEFEVEEDE